MIFARGKQKSAYRAELSSLSLGAQVILYILTKKFDLGGYEKYSNNFNSDIGFDLLSDGLPIIGEPEWQQPGGWECL